MTSLASLHDKPISPKLARSIVFEPAPYSPETIHRAAHIVLLDETASDYVREQAFVAINLARSIKQHSPREYHGRVS